MTSEATVKLNVQGRIAFLELNRPNSLNSINLEMIEELNQKMEEVKATETDILIIYGSGKVFSAGGDIKIMVNAMEQEHFYGVMDQINGLVRNLYTMPKLVISAVHGAAAGLGFSLALASDYLVAEKSATFAMNFIKIGLIPDGGGHYFLNKRLGESKAKQLIWEGKNLSAEEAYTLGLVDEITGKGIMDAAVSKAEEWLDMPIQSMLKTKEIVASTNMEELDKVLELEKKYQYRMRNTKDHQEGITAFLEKRKPNFIGK